jgi:hypothetical protein
MSVIRTPRPPLNLFEAVRAEIGPAWAPIYEVPSYLIPANGPSPERSIGAAVIMTGLLVSNTGFADISFSARIVGRHGINYPVLLEATVPPNDFALIGLDRQVMLSGEALEMRAGDAQSAVVHFTFILNQREEFEVITP